MTNHIYDYSIPLSDHEILLIDKPDLDRIVQAYFRDCIARSLGQVLDYLTHDEASKINP